MNIEELQDKLSAPFQVHEIHFRVGSTNRDKTSGMCLYYMDSRAVSNRLDEVCGLGGWQVRYPFKGYCEIGVKLYQQKAVFPPETANDLYEWIWKGNGAGETDFEGEKGQYSDAKKRAATEWGIGRYLYDADSKWYPIEQRGRSYVFIQNALGDIRRDYQTWLNRLQRQFRFKPGEKAELISEVDAALDAGDGEALKEILGRYPDHEQKMRVWALFTSWERDSIKKLIGT